MNWLVTGGAGYIGSHIVKCLVEDGHTVSILDNFSSGSINEIKNNVKVFNEDITNIAGVHRIFFENNFDGVIHTAAKKSVAQSFLEKELYENVNVFGTLNVLNFAIKTGVKNFIYSSSAAVYGVVDSDRIKEDTETNPISPYGVTKLVAEQLVTNDFESLRTHIHLNIQGFFPVFRLASLGFQIIPLNIQTGRTQIQQQTRERK